MATYASKLRPSAVDGATCRIHPGTGQLMANGGIMEPFSAGTKGGAPSVFYVDGNVVSSGNGLSWLSAFKTLAEGLAAAHSYESTSGNRAWAHRATVYACGDTLTESLVLGAEKTDVIGVGTSNSHDMPEIVGNHVPATNNTYGMRWFHCQFSEAAAGAIWTLQAQESGWKFIDCAFSVRGAASTHGILATALGYNLEVRDCFFDAYPNGFTTGAIVLGAGAIDKCLIRNNLILSKIGIVVNASITNTAGLVVIDNNTIVATTLCIDENSDKAIITNNTMVSAAACGASGGTIGNCLDYAATLACNNVLRGSDGCINAPSTDQEY